MGPAVAGVNSDGVLRVFGEVMFSVGVFLIVLTITWAGIEVAGDWRERRERKQRQRERAARELARVQEQMNNSITRMQAAYWQAREAMRREDRGDR